MTQSLSVHLQRCLHQSAIIALTTSEYTHLQGPKQCSEQQTLFSRRRRQSSTVVRALYDLSHGIAGLTA